MNVRTVTVVGANGTMGTNVSAIFASFGNAKVYMISRDIEKSEKAVIKAAKSVRAESIIKNLIPADYSMLSECVAKSDVVFESVSENIDVKLDITKKIASSLCEHAIVCSGTSGLSITRLAECFPEKMRSHYFGVHMFNPPYNMTLCELIKTKYTQPDVLESLKKYLQCTLFRTVVETKDSPAFLANRIGFQFINEAMQYAEIYKDNGGIDYIDNILGSFTGRAMPPLSTADFVGMDVHEAIVDNVYKNSNDYAHHTFALPTFAQKLIAERKLGRKTGQGLYKMEIHAGNVKRLMVYDINTHAYRDKMHHIFPFAEEMKKYIKYGDYDSAFLALINNRSQEAEICLHFLLSYIVYALKTTEDVAYNIHAADAAMATGFNWCPPLAMIDALSTVADVGVLVKERLSSVALSEIDIDGLLANAEKSRYDYRCYFRSAK